MNLKSVILRSIRLRSWGGSLPPKLQRHTDRYRESQLMELMPRSRNHTGASTRGDCNGKICTSQTFFKKSHGKSKNNRGKQNEEYQRKQPGCASVGEWIYKLWYICTIEYYFHHSKEKSY